MRTELRQALRALRRSPAFTITVVATLALGIGANAAMLGVIDRLMFRPAPYLREPSLVHRVYLQFDYRARTITTSTIPYTRWKDLERASHDFSEFAGFSEAPMAVGEGVAARERGVVGVSASFFHFFSAQPQRGRFFTAAEDTTPLGAAVVVLSDAFWRSEFGARDVLGQTLRLGNSVFTIIGVAPAGFVGVDDGSPPVAFVPITTMPLALGEGDAVNYARTYNWDWTSVLVRRREGISLAAATADLTNAYRASRAAQRAINPRVQPDSIAHPRAIPGALKTAAGPAAGLESRTLLWVSGVAAIVLLIACANVANLMLARALRRQRETAVRLALGVSRRRLIAQAMSESLLLATLGCAAGIVIAQWGGAALRSLVLPEGMANGPLTDFRTLSVAGALALAAAVLTGLAPALFATRSDLSAALKSDARAGGAHRSRTRSALLVLQAALSVILLVGAGLFVRSLEKVRTMDLGYDAEPVLIAEPNLRGMAMDSGAIAAFRRRLLATAQEISGVEFAARVDSRPFGTSTWDLFVAGIDSVARLGRFNYQGTTPEYFKVMGARIVRGRGLDEADRDGAPRVAVVSESMARAIWPGKDAIGECMRVGAATAPCTTVVGIAADAVQQSLIDDPHFTYYLPVEQLDARGGSDMFLRVRGRDPAAMLEPVRRALQKAMPGQGYVTVSPLENVIDAQRRSWQLGATMFVAFGVLALAVAAVGLYGVIAYDVAQRRHELGVRIALGAQSHDIVRLVVRQGVSFAGAGVALGLTLSLAAARWIQPLLFQESARDPLTYGAVAVMLLLVAVAACALPARRAAGADPNEALRAD